MNETRMKSLAGLFVVAVVCPGVAAAQSAVTGTLKTNCNAAGVTVVSVNGAADAGGIYIEGSRFTGTAVDSTSLNEVAVIAVHGSARAALL